MLLEKKVDEGNEEKKDNGEGEIIGYNEEENQDDNKNDK